MPRSPRIDFPGLIYHVTNRGTNRQAIFLSDQDRQDFLRLALITRNEFPFILHAYCLMTNHFHLLIQTIEDSLSRTMQYMTGLYGQRFNRRYGRSGRLHQDRFHSIPVQDDAYFTVAARYIDLNAVRAGMALRPEEYPWCSYGRLVRGESDPLVDPSFLLGYFGKEPTGQRRRYQEFVESMMGKVEPITERALNRMTAWGNLSVITSRSAMAQIPTQISTAGQTPAVG